MIERTKDGKKKGGKHRARRCTTFPAERIFISSARYIIWHPSACTNLEIPAYRNTCSVYKLCLVDETGKYRRRGDLKCNGSLRNATENRIGMGWGWGWGWGWNRGDPSPYIPPLYITFLYLNRLLFDFRLLHFNIAFSIFIHQLLAFISPTPFPLSVSLLLPCHVFLNITDFISYQNALIYNTNSLLYTQCIGNLCNFYENFCLFFAFKIIDWWYNVAIQTPAPSLPSPPIITLPSDIPLNCRQSNIFQSLGTSSSLLSSDILFPECLPFCSKQMCWNIK